MALVHGQFFCAEGTRTGNTWHWDIQKGRIGPRQVEKIEEIERSFESSAVAETSSFWKKTAQFAGRSLVAAATCAIPFAAVNGYSAWNGSASGMGLIKDTALFSAGVGLFSGAICDDVNQAGSCGLLLGSAAQAATMLGGVGSGSLLKKAGQAKEWAATQLATGLGKADGVKNWGVAQFQSGLEKASQVKDTLFVKLGIQEAAAPKPYAWYNPAAYWPF